MDLLPSQIKFCDWKVYLVKFCFCIKLPLHSLIYSLLYNVQIFTAMAFTLFARENVDIAVIEVIHFKPFDVFFLHFFLLYSVGRLLTFSVLLLVDLFYFICN